MKKVFYILSAITVGIAPLTIINCEQALPSGIVTDVPGRVWDSLNQRPLQGANVYLAPCYFGRWMTSGCHYPPVDSAVTDASGRYTVKVVTDGEADAYEVFVQADQTFYANSRERVRPGERNFITLYAQPWDHLDLHLHIKDNTIGPIRIYTYRGTYSSIPQHTRDTTLYLSFLAPDNTIVFDAYDPTLEKPRIRTELFEVSTDDTTFVTMTIDDPAKWP